MRTVFILSPCRPRIRVVQQRTTASKNKGRTAPHPRRRTNCLKYRSPSLAIITLYIITNQKKKIFFIFIGNQDKVRV